MSKQIPTYLKLHVETSTDGPTLPTTTASALDALRESFHQITGWPLRLDSQPAHDPSNWNATNDRGIGRSPSRLSINLHSSRSCDGDPAADLAVVGQHVAALNKLLDELDRTRHALWQREAELAVSVPVVEHADEAAHLAYRLESVLKSAAQSVGCQAAALYLLDDATTHLKMRAAWGLPRERFSEPARPLRGAVADLEALLGHAVVLKDTEILPHWKAPENFPGAVGVPVATPTTLLGTLWVFADEVSDFDETKTNLLEIVAGRLAADLEREVLLQQTVRSKRVDLQLARAATRQRGRLPNIKPLLDGWQLAGWMSPIDALGGDFYDWSILPDSRLMVAVGDAEGELIEAGLTAASLQAAIKSHAFYRHDPCQMLDRLNETLWTASSGDQLASLFYAQIDPESGKLSFCAAGDVGAILLCGKKCEVLTESGPLLGIGPDATFEPCDRSLRRGEVLVVFSGGVRSALSKIESQRAEAVLAAVLQQQRFNSAEEIIDYIRDLISTYDAAPAEIDQTVLVVRRA